MPRHTARLIEYKGVTKTLAAWARNVGISRQLLRSRLEAGWPISRALSPADQNRSMSGRGRELDSGPRCSLCSRPGRFSVDLKDVCSGHILAAIQASPGQREFSVARI